MTSLHTSNPVSRQRWLQTALETLFLLPLALYDVSERRRLSCTCLFASSSQSEEDWLKGGVAMSVFFFSFLTLFFVFVCLAKNDIE